MFVFRTKANLIIEATEKYLFFTLIISFHFSQICIENISFLHYIICTGCPKKNWDFVQFLVFMFGSGVFRGKK